MALKPAEIVVLSDEGLNFAIRHWEAEAEHAEEEMKLAIDNCQLLYAEEDRRKDKKNG